MELVGQLSDHDGCLEAMLRKHVEDSGYCTLRTGCRVVGRSSSDPPAITYVDERDGQERQVKGDWLIGADGKVGVVRKHFLEPTAGIRQEDGKYRYNGTWIAANLKITPPTPETHPEFPLWKLGYSPEEAYELFWPRNWHFCTPPGKPTATGRFGPPEDRTWRHELCQEDWDDSMDAETLFWEHITPMITRQGDGERGRCFPAPVTYPADCIEILRCRPFRFAHKVVNRWFHGRTILIGDAAHVFPPFAGQGIASGIRDAHQLAWRLCLVLRLGRMDQPLLDRILEPWALERRDSVDGAALFSIANGGLCNNRPSIWLRITLFLVMFLESRSYLPQLPDDFRKAERVGFSKVKGGFSLEAFNGGIRLAQIRVQSSLGGAVLSDSLLRHSGSVFTLLVICDGIDDRKLFKEARATVSDAEIDPNIISESSVVAFNPGGPRAVEASTKAGSDTDMTIFWPYSTPDTSDPLQHDQAYMERLGSGTRFALLRPDLFIFACCRDAMELSVCLYELREKFGR